MKGLINFHQGLELYKYICFYVIVSYCAFSKMYIFTSVGSSGSNLSDAIFSYCVYSLLNIFIYIKKFTSVGSSRSNLSDAQIMT